MASLALFRLPLLELYINTEQMTTRLENGQISRVPYAFSLLLQGTGRSTDQLFGQTKQATGQGRLCAHAYAPSTEAELPFRRASLQSARANRTMEE